MNSHNVALVISHFASTGIPVDDILPYENVLTFHQWKERGRFVKKGQHGCRVVTFIPIVDKETQKVKGTRPWSAVVFHISQTEPFIPA